MCRGTPVEATALAAVHQSLTNARARARLNAPRYLGGPGREEQTGTKEETRLLDDGYGRTRTRPTQSSKMVGSGGVRRAREAKKRKTAPSVPDLAVLSQHRCFFKRRYLSFIAVIDNLLCMHLGCKSKFRLLDETADRTVFVETASPGSCVLDRHGHCCRRVEYLLGVSYPGTMRR